MNDPNPSQTTPPPLSAPIAAPDGRVAPLPPSQSTTVVRGNYKTAPQIVKSARLLAMLTIVIGLMVLIAAFADGVTSESLPMSLFGFFLLGMGVWLCAGHTRGQSAAWIGQIVMSAIGLTGFPLGTLIHGYLLAKWFTPDVKAWYGR